MAQADNLIINQRGATTMKDDVSDKAVMGNYQLTATMANGKTFNVSGYLFSGESVESINGRVDLLHEVMDRQRVRAEIPELEIVRENKITHLSQQEKVLAGLLEQKANGEKLTSSQKQLIENMSVSITALKSDIDKGTQLIAEAKRKVGMV